MSVAVAEGLFVERPDGVCLVAGRAKANGEMRFPMPRGADAALYDAVELASVGKLWSYTVQRFRPKTPRREVDGFMVRWLCWRRCS